MMQAMMIVLGAYLALCYAYGMYLAVRLFTGRHLRRAATGMRRHPLVRPLHPADAAQPTAAGTRRAAHRAAQAQAA